MLRNFKQKTLAKPEHKGQGQEGKEHRGGCTGILPQAGTQGKGLSKVLSILLGQHHIKSSLYDSGTQAPLGLRSLLKLGATRRLQATGGIAWACRSVP